MFASLLWLFATLTAGVSGPVSSPRESLRIVVWSWSDRVDEIVDRSVLESRESTGMEVEFVRVPGNASLRAGTGDEREEALERLARAVADRRGGRQKRAVGRAPEGYVDQLLERLGGRMRPDLAWVRVEMLPELAATGRLLALDRFVEQRPDLIAGTSARLLDRYRRDGRLYAVPLADSGPLSECGFAVTNGINVAAALDFVSRVRAKVFRPVRVSKEGPLEADFEKGEVAGWNLSRGARIAGDRGDRRLVLQGSARATWGDVAVQTYSLAFRYLPGRGEGTVRLQCPMEAGQKGEYRLVFEPAGLKLLRVDGREEQVLGAARQVWAADEWYDVTVHSVDGWLGIVVDGLELIQVVDPNPLGSGGVTFSSKGSDAIAYADIRLDRWSALDARRIRDRLRREEPLEKQPPLARVPPLPSRVIPLERLVYAAPKEPHPINPGYISPTFVHTWAIDLAGIDRFKMYFKSLADIALDPTDRLTFFGAASAKQGKPLRSITVKSVESDLIVDVSQVPVDIKHGSRGYRRLYMQLETSQKYLPRHFLLRGLEVLAPNGGSPEALVLANDLHEAANYSGPITETHDASGKIIKIYSPWNPLPLYGPQYPAARRADGWYLVGEYLADNGQGFVALIYYNEAKGRLRAYLRNHSLTDATVYSVRLSLLGKNAQAAGVEMIDQYEELKGAIFPVHPDPGQWSSIIFPIKTWPKMHWVMVETPILYPMLEALPAAAAPAPSNVPKNYYRSLYEDELQAGRRNVLLQIEVGSYLEGALEADLVGKAVGTAIQDLSGGGGPDSMTIVKGVWDAIQKGKDWYDGAEKLHGKAEKYYNKLQKQGGPAAGDPSMNVLGGLVSLGATAWAGPAGLAGAAFSLMSSFLFSGTPEPLQLSIELSLRGSLKGTVKIPYQSRKCWIYLPGRFGITEAFAEGLPPDARATVESFAPRYDRSLGLFGFRYNPGDVTFPVARCESAAGATGKDWDRSPTLVYPAIATPDPRVVGSPIDSEWKKLGRKTIDQLLPVIYNPFAEITPMAPVVVSTAARNDDLYAKWPYSNLPYEWSLRYRWLYDVSWKTHVTPEPDDLTFPGNVTLHDTKGPAVTVKVFGSRIKIPAGLYVYSEPLPEGNVMQVLPRPDLVPRTYHAFKEIHNIKVTSSCVAAWAADQPFDAADPHPIHDVMYYWDLPYFYYARTRKAGDGTVPRSFQTEHLRSPVTVDVKRFTIVSWYPTIRTGVSSQKKAKSRLLVGAAAK